MNIRIRPYIPLIGFVVPTVLVGYGAVIPRSCIAGVNELTVGFGATAVGAVLAYVAGQRAVTTPNNGSRLSLGARIKRAINRQAAFPSGWFGRLLGQIWRHEHARLNAEVLEALDVRPSHQVLEIGPGPGHALSEAARRARDGLVMGLDISPLMVKLARKRNQSHVARGNVELRVGDISDVALGSAHFDRIYSVHSVYFWSDLDAVLAKLSTALKSDGKLVLAFMPESEDIPARFRDPIYRYPQLTHLTTTLRRLGLVVDTPRSSHVAPRTLLLTALKR